MNAVSAIFPLQRTGAADALESDPLSDVFGTLRMRDAALFKVSAQAPWAVEQGSAKTVLPLIMPAASQLISYHIVVQGSCYARLASGGVIRLDPGQVIVFTRGDPHVLSSEPDPVAANRASSSPQAPLAARFGTGPVTAELICGFLGRDALSLNPLLDNLPPILIGHCAEGSGLPALRDLIGRAVGEATNERAGGQTVLGRLAELMFIEVVRQHFEQLPTEGQAWLAGLRDMFVGRALSLMHGNPGRPWSINGLAREIGLSRSEFAERFSSFVGVPPMQYLTRWRMQTAAGLLRERHNIALVANEVGYSSEASFSRAFKKVVGLSPAHWRQREGLLAA